MQEAIRPEQVVDSSRLLSYFELSKPELTFLASLSAGWAYALASDLSFSVFSLGLLILANVFVGAGAGSLNMLIERREDTLMKRTERRPLPSERLTPGAVLIFALVNAVAGLSLLAFQFSFTSAFLALLTLVLYVFVYTPLKHKTSLNTLIGAIPGALPTLIGWTAWSKQISIEGWLLFTLLYVWQLPHFHSLAWMYRKDYGRAGFKMLAVQDGERGRKTSAQIVTFAFLFIPLSGAFYYFGLSGAAFGLVGSAISFFMLIPGWRMSAATWRSGNAATEVNTQARRVFFGSLIALPLYMLTLLLDRIFF